MTIILTPMGQPPSLRQGISLIEVMIAISLLGVALTTTIGVLTQVTKLQESTLSREVATITTSNLTNLYASASLSEIVAWNASGSLRLASTDDAALSTVQDLVQRQVLSPEVGHLQDQEVDSLNRLRFSVGFYRTIANTDPSGVADPAKPGLWAPQAPETTKTTITTLGTPEQRAQVVITDLDDSDQITEGHPVTMVVQVVEVDGSTVTRVRNQFTSILATPLP